MDVVQLSPIEKLIKDNDVASVHMNTNIIQDTLNDSKNLLMPVIATILSYIKPMICSNYDKSQEAAVKFLEVISDMYWKEILKTCGMPVNNSSEEGELKRIKSAQKARDLLVDIAMNVTGAKISSSRSRCNLRRYARSFKKF